MSEQNAPLSFHLKELRRRLIISVIAIFLTTGACFIFLREWLMEILVKPFEALHLNLIFIGVSEAFLSYIKVSLLAGIVLASPIFIWQIFAFILPAFYKNEKRVLLLVSISGTFLFVFGVVFAYFIVLEPTLRVLTVGFSGNFIASVTAEYYLNFVFKFILPFALAFEIPLIIYFLAKLELVNAKQLKTWRKYVVLIILIFAGFLTPPDIVSQTFLALPMYVLFECSILIALLVARNKDKKKEKEHE